ncbi:MAG: hypothetical protein MUD17_00950 [Gemmatimonadaceae bacterium]|jgi:hypothetical protein|nr:hypothetical protein [Gemmatimonadaceae bacterium]
MPRLTLEQFVTQLAGIHGDRLRCVLLYGSAAIGHTVADRSDQNVLVLLDRIEASQLEALAATVHAWREAGNPPPFELTVAEWERSADIFPMEYADIQEQHRVLHGALPPAAPVHRADLRRQAEYEAMGKVLRLRQALMHAGTDGAMQLDVLRASHGTLMAVFRAAVRVLGERAPTDRRALIDRVAAAASLDSTPFARVHDDLRNGRPIAAREAEAVLLATLDGMERLAAWLDTFDPGTGPV